VRLCPDGGEVRRSRLLCCGTRDPESP
jgi:hypothetical protein